MANALITGASRGIGKACALAFARAGYCVGINYASSKEQAEATEREIRAGGGTALLLQADVSREDACQGMAAAFCDRFGRIDVLINNAGVSCDKLFTDTSPEEWRRTLAVNLDGPYNCCRAVLPQMISRKEGCILNISSMWGQVGASCEVAYSAAKAGVIGLTKALAKELGPSNIRVNCIAPGVINTDMNAALSPADLAALAEETPLGRIGMPEEIAAAALFLARAPFITGQVLGVNGGFVI